MKDSSVGKNSNFKSKLRILAAMNCFAFFFRKLRFENNFKSFCIIFKIYLLIKILFWYVGFVWVFRDYSFWVFLLLPFKLQFNLQNVVKVSAFVFAYFAKEVHYFWLNANLLKFCFLHTNDLIIIKYFLRNLCSSLGK